MWHTNPMRTTLEFDENILRAAQLSASEQGQALAELIEAAVRNYLGLGDSEATQVSEDTVDDSWSGASRAAADG